MKGLEKTHKDVKVKRKGVLDSKKEHLQELKKEQEKLMQLCRE